MPLAAPWPLHVPPPSARNGTAAALFDDNASGVVARRLADSVYEYAVAGAVAVSVICSATESGRPGAAGHDDDVPPVVHDAVTAAISLPMVWSATTVPSLHSRRRSVFDAESSE